MGQINTLAPDGAGGGGAAVQTFSFEGGCVRVLQRGGDPWWVAVDIGKALGLGGNGRDVTVGLDEDEKGVGIIITPSGNQQVTCVSESGLYSLIFRSRRPEARRFRRWVTGEVLPAIRRTGGYNAAPPAPQPPALPGPASAAPAATVDVSALSHTQRLLVNSIVEQLSGGGAA